MVPLKTILLFTDWFEPGFKAGGPIRSCVNFARHMKEDYHICVFTSDRDLHDTQSYAGIATNSWISFEPEIEVYYCSPSQLTWKNIVKQWETIQPDFIYLNSMFSLHFTIYPLLIARQHKKRTRTILAPRGMLKTSALFYKRRKKKIFLALFSLSGLHRRIHFHATDPTEVKDVQQLFGKEVQVTEAGNFPGYVGEYRQQVNKAQGELRMIYIGRIHPIKNLDFLLQLLPGIQGTVLLTVIGGEEDKAYATLCKDIAKDLPQEITVDFMGEVPNKNVGAFLDIHHIFALPTNGENFGHAIFEALSAGKPVLISDQTPWRNLEANKAGWDLSLKQPAFFAAAIQQAVDFSQEEFTYWSKHAWQYVDAYVKRSNLKTAYQQLFN